MKGAYIFLLAAFTAACASCEKDTITGNGSIQTQERDVSAFNRVATQGSTVIHIVQGTVFEVKVKGYANLLPYLKTIVNNGTLSVHYEDTRSVRNDNSEVFITMPALTGLSSQGSGDIYVAGAFNNNLDAAISGSANIVVEKGSADHFTLQSFGSGNFKSFGFTATAADITIAGSGDTEIGIVQQLKAKIRGSGNIYYKGDPAAVEIDISGSGKVIKR